MYVGYNGTVPPLVINTAGLTGGKTSPWANYTVLRNFSSHVVFESIDYRFLRTPESKPTVDVKVNNIPAVCLNYCGYDFTNESKILSISVNGPQLVMTISNPLAIYLELSRLTVMAASIGISCSLISSANASVIYLTCLLPMNSDGSTALPAGALQIQVFIQGLGYLPVDTAVTPIEVPFVVTGLNQSSGSNNGGYLNAIFGSGFAGGSLDNSVSAAHGQGSVNSLKVKICNQSADVKSVTNQKIVFEVPACSDTGLQTITITQKEYSVSNYSFNYTAVPSTAPTITGVFPLSTNPRLKSTISILGLNFGNATSAVKVYLNNDQGEQAY
jgi:hypothetical protein